MYSWYCVINGRVCWNRVTVCTCEWSTYRLELWVYLGLFSRKLRVVLKVMCFRHFCLCYLYSVLLLLTLCFLLNSLASVLSYFFCVIPISVLCVMALFILVVYYCCVLLAWFWDVLKLFLSLSEVFWVLWLARPASITDLRIVDLYLVLNWCLFAICFIFEMDIFLKVCWIVRLLWLVLALFILLFLLQVILHLNLYSSDLRVLINVI